MSWQFPGRIEYVVEGTAYVLCPELGWLAELPATSGEQALFETDGWLAADAWFQPTGGASGTVRFTTEETFPTMAEAQAAFALPEFVDGLALFAAAGTLRITLLDDTVIEYTPAVLASVEPDLPDDAPTDEGNGVLRRTWTFQTPAAPSVA
jgi:hypothetical protein